MITFENVSKRFTLHHEKRNSFQERLVGLFKPRGSGETFWGLKNVSFTVPPGETLGLIGHNGSGKSTTLKLISRILEPSQGRVSVSGRVSALLELGSGFHPDLTGRDNIFLNGSLLGFSRQEMARKVDEIVDFAELGAFIDTPVKHYSSGMYMRLGFAVATAVDPDILITDEVLAVGDENFQRKCYDRIFEFRQQGRTIVFVSHALEAVRALCTQVVWLDHGEMRAVGKANEVINQYLASVNRVEQARLEEQAETPPDATATAPNRHGSREAEITDVDFLDGSGKSVALAYTNQPFTIRIHYVAHQLLVLPMFGLALHDSNGFHINGPNNVFANYPIPSIKGKGFVDYVVPSLPLLGGRYVVTAALLDTTGTHHYDTWLQHWSFRVAAEHVEERYGTLYIPSRWEWGGNGKAS